MEIKPRVSRVIVTGGGSGIGLEIAKNCFNIIAVYVSREEMKKN